MCPVAIAADGRHVHADRILLARGLGFENVSVAGLEL